MRSIAAATEIVSLGRVASNAASVPLAAKYCTAEWSMPGLPTAM
jgi:hypothetical protein